MVAIDNAITVVSTRARDHLPDGSIMEGGPAHYIGTALDRLGHPWELITGQVAPVHVALYGGEEHYVIPSLEPIALPPTLPGPATILSPIMREIPPEAVPATEGLLLLDLQGFVRRPSTPELGKDVDLTALLARADAVKASPAELAALDSASRRMLDHTVVLVTGGERGTVVRHRGREWRVAAQPVRAHHSIGAGDMYLGAFAVALLRRHEPCEAAEFAARFTERMLAERA
ncbi:MAG TPA: PfkB family carbohydrate kinase [Chloroflexota bacterium]|nr:PfkB family carbohydrate kinase [Chloroflexota bacterium]